MSASTQPNAPLLCKTHQENLLELHNCFSKVLSRFFNPLLFHFAFNNLNTTPLLYALTRVCLAVRSPFFRLLRLVPFVQQGE